MADMRIRLVRPDDAAALAALFYDSVHRGARDAYDTAQRRSWAPRVPETAAWRARLGDHTGFVAERDGDPIGFMTLRADGRIDLAFVAPDAIGQGVAKALYDEILREAVRAEMPRLHAEASLMARPFFERQGWVVIAPETVVRDGVSIPRFRMEKRIGT